MHPCILGDHFPAQPFLGTLFTAPQRGATSSHSRYMDALCWAYAFCAGMSARAWPGRKKMTLLQRNAFACAGCSSLRWAATLPPPPSAQAAASDASQLSVHPGYHATLSALHLPALEVHSWFSPTVSWCRRNEKGISAMSNDGSAGNPA